MVKWNQKIAKVLTIGVPHPVYGETAYKVPKEIEFRDELPKTNVGKILRRVLRDEEIARRAGH